MATPVRVRRLTVGVAVLLVALGVLAVVARLDAPDDGTLLWFGSSTWSSGGAVVDVPEPVPGPGLRSGDTVTAIAGHRLADGLGAVPVPRPGETLEYEVEPGAVRPVRIDRAAVGPLLGAGWGDLVFVLIFGVLGFALYLRRPEEPATAPLLLLAAGLFGSTLTVVAGLPVLALAVGGPRLWLFHVNVIGSYSVAWGALVASSLLFVPGHPWLARRRRVVLAAAYAGPVGFMAVWAAGLAVAVDNPMRRLGLLHGTQTVVTVVSLLVSAVSIGIAYRRTREPTMRNRLRWVAGAGAAGAAAGIAGWTLPEMVAGAHPLPPGAFGLTGLPFVAGVAVALRRHRLFDIERLVNRSLVYATVVGGLVALYTAAVALLASALRFSDVAAAAVAAAVAALVLAPLRATVQGWVNRLMYGRRDDPAGALAALGSRLHDVLLPDEVSATVVETVVRSLRVPYVAVDVADGAGGLRRAATHGTAVAPVHVEPLLHYGETVGQLHVSGRGRDDPLEPADLALIRSLAQQIGPALLAVRLHNDLVRSRAEVVSLREDERRRLRRELHDGLGPALAAIGLKAGLAARAVPAGAPRKLLDEISDEVRASLADLRRVVEALRPPALDELGLMGAVRRRAAGLGGELAIDVRGPEAEPGLPAAVELAAYRIAVEGMTNAARHSGGERCTVSIEVGDREVVVEVRDDGRGHDRGSRPGVGVRSMHERAAELGGACTVRSADGAGTVVLARLPLDVGAPR